MDIRRGSTPMPLRALIIWFALLVLAVANGGFREGVRRRAVDPPGLSCRDDRDRPGLARPHPRVRVWVWPRARQALGGAARGLRRPQGADLGSRAPHDGCRAVPGGASPRLAPAALPRVTSRWRSEAPPSSHHRRRDQPRAEPDLRRFSAADTLPSPTSP